MQALDDQRARLLGRVEQEARKRIAADRAAAQIRTQRLLATVAVAGSLGAGWTPQAPLATIANTK